MFNSSDLTPHAPGLFGSLAALLWIKDTWPRRIGYVLTGTAASHYCAPSIAMWTGADLALAGFLVGLFSMAVAAKLFESIEALKPADAINRLLTRLGL